MVKKLTPKEKLMAYYLNREFGYNQTGIAGMMNVSQPTITYAIKDAKYMILEKNYEQLAKESRTAAQKKIESPQNFIEADYDHLDS